MQDRVNVWRLIAHHEDREWALHWSRQNERIAIRWGLVGDLRQQGYRSAAEVGAAIRREYPGIANSGLGGPSVWDFYDGIEVVDLVILSSDAGRAAVFEVQGDYEWVPNSAGYGRPYPHQRRARLRSLDPERLWRAAGARAAEGQSIRRTLIRCADPVSQADL